MAVKSGAQDLVVAGGVENMTRVPMGADMGRAADEPDGEVRTSCPRSLGRDDAERWKFTRQQLDEFSLASQQKAWKAIQEGKFARSIVPIEVTTTASASGSIPTSTSGRRRRSRV
jgi:acetyl-CoA acetyltransferase